MLRRASLDTYVIPMEYGNAWETQSDRRLILLLFRTFDVWLPFPLQQAKFARNHAVTQVWICAVSLEVLLVVPTDNGLVPMV